MRHYFGLSTSWRPCRAHTFIAPHFAVGCLTVHPAWALPPLGSVATASSHAHLLAASYSLLPRGTQSREVRDSFPLGLFLFPVVLPPAAPASPFPSAPCLPAACGAPFPSHFPSTTTAHWGRPEPPGRPAPRRPPARVPRGTTGRARPSHRPGIPRPRPASTCAASGAQFSAPESRSRAPGSGLPASGERGSRGRSRRGAGSAAAGNARRATRVQGAHCSFSRDPSLVPPRPTFAASRSSFLLFLKLFLLSNSAVAEFPIFSC